MRRLVPLALLAALAAAQDTPADAWKAIQKEYRDARTEFFRPWREAKAKGEAFVLDYTKHPDRVFPARYREFAVKHAGTPVAADAWAEIVRLGPTEEAKVEALGMLFDHHMDSKALRSVIWSLRFRSDAEQRLQTIAEKSPHEDLRGLALLVRGQVVKKRDTEGAKAIFAKVKEKYGDVAYSGKTTLAQKVAGELFEIDNLAIGQVVPEIEGEDIDGVAFKLSDYRGKVVVIDFWGDW